MDHCHYKGKKKNKSSGAGLFSAVGKTLGFLAIRGLWLPTLRERGLRLMGGQRGMMNNSVWKVLGIHYKPQW